MKKFLFILLMVFACFGFTACKKDDASDDNNDDPNIENPDNNDDNNQEEPENVKTLKAIALDTTNVKVAYKINETLSTEGLVVVETYSNTLTEDTTENVTDLAGYTVKVLFDEAEVTGAFTKLGEYEVVVSKETFSQSYNVNVEARTFESVADAIDAGIAAQNKVVSGVATLNQFDYDTVTNYEFGKDYTMIGTEYGVNYYELLDEETVFGVVVGTDFDGNTYYEAVSEPSVTNLVGADFSDLFSYSYEIYGLEALVQTAYQIGSGEGIYNFKSEVVAGEETSYKFSFEILLEGYYYYFVEVTFTLDGEAEIFNNVTLSMKGYYLDNLDYNEEEDKYTVKEGIEEYDMTRELTVTQVAGERTKENEYPASRFLYKSFEIQDAEGNKVENNQQFELAIGEELALNVVNATPETADGNVDVITVTVLDEFGMETWNVYGSYYDGVISITASKSGTYSVVIATAACEYTISIVVDYAELTEINAGILNDWFEYEIVTEVEVYVGQELEIKGVANEGADDSCTIVLKEETVDASLVDAGYAAFFQATATGTYEVVLTSTVNPDLTASLVITVVDLPSLAEVLTGSYTCLVYGVGNITLTFNPESEGAEKGTLTLADQDVTYNFEYEVVDGYLQTIPADNAAYDSPYSVEFNAQFELVLLHYGWETGTFER